MTGRRWSKAKIADALAAGVGMVPDRRAAGELTFLGSGVVRLLSVYAEKHDPDVLRWQVGLADAKYHDMVGAGGWVWIGINDRCGAPWPTDRAGADELVATLLPAVRGALDLVTDRKGLAAALLEPVPVTYPDHELSTIAGNVPVRLVQALILARDIPAPDIEVAARERLGAPGVGFRDTVARWTRDRFLGKVDVDLSDLAAIKG